jgi:hypothetical protein
VGPHLLFIDGVTVGSGGPCGCLLVVCEVCQWWCGDGHPDTRDKQLLLPGKEVVKSKQLC